MKNPIIWATTPEAKAKAAASTPNETSRLNDCEKMRRARKIAERVTRELREETEKKTTASPSEMTGE